MAHTIKLTAEKVQQLFDFCNLHGKAKFFIAKDHGAYVGASNGPDDKCIFYFNGCNPKTDADCFDTCQAKFGGDDFGAFVDTNILRKNLAGLEIKVLRSGIIFRPIASVKAAAPAKKANPFPSVAANKAADAKTAWDNLTGSSCARLRALAATWAGTRANFIAFAVSQGINEATASTQFAKGRA